MASDEAVRTPARLQDSIDDLLAAARDAMAQAYAPYSDFPVGAALRAADGAVYSGCNVENAAYPQGCCAEASAISAMVRAGQRAIREVLVVTNGDHVAPPCGGCRQRIREFGAADTLVHICDQHGVRETLSLAALLPMAFGPEHLDR